MLRWSISYESHELLDVFVVRSTQFSSSIHFPLVNFTFCELPPIAIKTSPPLTTVPCAAAVARAACRAMPVKYYNSNSPSIFFVFETRFCRILCLFVWSGVQALSPFVSYLQLQSRHCNHLPLGRTPQPSPVLLAALCWLNSTIKIILQIFLFLRQNCEKIFYNSLFHLGFRLLGLLWAASNCN